MVRSMQFPKNILSVCIAGALASFVLAGPSWAADSEESDTSMLEEVTVTAERRAVSVQEIPLSAVALSGLTLEKRDINTMEQLQYAVPSLIFTDNGNTRYVNIRGVGQSESAPNQTQGVAVHLDGAYVAREFVFGDAFFDLDSIEVLRGPQGTYSGQNASGGAIFINSRRPVLGETDGFINAELGNYGRKRVGGAVSIPLTDTLAARISGDWERRDSFYNNHGPNMATDPDQVENQPGNLDRSFGRVQLLWAPNDDLEFRLIYEMSDFKTDGVPYRQFPEPGSNKLPDDPWELNYDLAGHRNVEYDRTTMQFNWDATSAFRVVGNLSTLQSHQHYLDDGDNSSVVTNPTAVQAGADYTIDDNYWTGELTLVSTNEGPFEWTVGGFYLDYQQDNYLNFLRYNHPSYPGTGLDVNRHTRLYFYLDNVRTNKALFGEIGYHLTDNLQVKAGLRYNKDEVGFDPDSYICAGPFPPGRQSHYNCPAEYGAPIPARELLDFDKVTGRVLVNWQLNDENMLYATISRGYKPGGTTPFAQEYDSEEVTNYEMGWKGTLLDGNLSGAVSVYHMAYDNFQRTYSTDPDNPAAQVTRNVDGSTIDGIEVQLAGRIQNFLWDASIAYNDGTYGDLEFVFPAGVEDTVNPTSPMLVNIKGQPIDYLPEFVYNFGLSYEGFAVGQGTLIPSVRIMHQDKYYTTFFHYDYNLTPSKTLVDGFLTYDSGRDWTLQLYGKNLADKTYISRAQGGDDGIGDYLLGNRRELGVKLNYQF